MRKEFIMTENENIVTTSLVAASPRELAAAIVKILDAIKARDI